MRAQLGPSDRTHRENLPVTTPARTLLDIAAITDAEQLERAVAEAHFLKLAKETDLRAQLERHKGRRGTRALREVLDLPGGPQRTRSGGETRMLRLLRSARITGFQANAKIHGYEVDFLWRELSFGIEVDGWDGHSSRLAFERDRVKIARLTAKGLTVMLVSGKRLTRAPEQVERDVRQALEARRKATRSTSVSGSAVC